MHTFEHQCPRRRFFFFACADLWGRRGIKRSVENDPFGTLQEPKWVWVKIRPPKGPQVLVNFSSLFPFTRIQIGVPTFDPHPNGVEGFRIENQQAKQIWQARRSQWTIWMCCREWFPDQSTCLGLVFWHEIQDLGGHL